MKLSDALRGAADRAPVDDATISVEAASSRVRRHRAARAGSTGLVGAGAVAVIAFAAMGPLAGTDDAFDGGQSSADAAMESEMDAPAMAEEDSAAGDTRLAEQWMCGSTFDANDPAWVWGDASGVTFTAGEPAIDGEELQVPHTLEAQRPVSLISSPDTLVVWDGIVVGRMVAPDPLVYGPADQPSLPEGEVYERVEAGTALEQTTVLAPVNCWDGAPLPPATYEVHQAWTLAYADTADAGAGAGEEPAADAPGDSSAVEPSEMPTEESVIEPVPDEALPAPGMEVEMFRVAAEPTGLVIEGEPMDDPFGAYLGGDEPGEPVPLPQPLEPQPLPDGYLTPDIAREMFEANRADGTWDMTAGTQRVVKVNDSRSDNPDGDWQENFYGCVWDDSVDGEFPARSAELDLLDVDVSLPSSISVSYGFVVDGNPLVDATVANSSAYTIPGMWNGAAQQLFLVKDGRVVAEAYPQSLDDHLTAMARDGAVMGDAEDIELTIAPQMEGTLAPGARVSGQYLWRDVNGCGEAGSVDAGTYTVLAAQSISLSGEGGDLVMYGEGDAGATEPSAILPEPAVDLPLTDGADPAIEPAPMGEQDWLELQVYTSLGTLTVR